MNFTPFKEKLEIPIGGTFAPEPWVWATGETVDTATPVDLTGCSAEMHIREKLESPTILMTLSTANNRIVLGGALGTIALRITDEDTAAIAWKSGVYDLRITFPGGESVYFVEGNVTADRKVTRSA
jgi:hypothetical protein